MTVEELLFQLEGDYLSRLRWLVLKEFGVLPGSKRAGELSDEELIRCGVQMLLDRKGGFAQNGECEVNASFDEGVFSALKGG